MTGKGYRAALVSHGAFQLLVCSLLEGQVTGHRPAALSSTWEPRCSPSLLGKLGMTLSITNITETYNGWKDPPFSLTLPFKQNKNFLKTCL